MNNLQIRSDEDALYWAVELTTRLTKMIGDGAVAAQSLRKNARIKIPEDVWKVMIDDMCGTALSLADLAERLEFEDDAAADIAAALEKWQSERPAAIE